MENDLLTTLADVKIRTAVVDPKAELKARGGAKVVTTLVEFDRVD